MKLTTLTPAILLSCAISLGAMASTLPPPLSPTCADPQKIPFCETNTSKPMSPVCIPNPAIDQSEKTGGGVFARVDANETAPKALCPEGMKAICSDLTTSVLTPACVVENPEEAPITNNSSGTEVTTTDKPPITNNGSGTEVTTTDKPPITNNGSGTEVTTDEPAPAEQPLP